jgi:hypothetical protein
MTEKRTEGAHSYKIDCGQFMAEQRSWTKNGATRGLSLGVMTLDFDRIWIKADEVSQITTAIQSGRSPIALG